MPLVCGSPCGWDFYFGWASMTSDRNNHGNMQKKLAKSHIVGSRGSIKNPLSIILFLVECGILIRWVWPLVYWTNEFSSDHMYSYQTSKNGTWDMEECGGNGENGFGGKGGSRENGCEAKIRGK